MNKWDIKTIIKGLESKKGAKAHQLMLPETRVLEEAPKEAKKAAVMLLIYPKENVLHTVFIQRSVYKGAHSGQISFPGGMHECGDASLLHTAIRETFEEIGVLVTNQNIIGCLTPLYISVSKIKVYPYVAYIEPCCAFNTDTKEVVHVIETPISMFFEPETRQEGIVLVGDTQINVPFFAVNDKKIWGATSMILSEFIDCMNSVSTENNCCS